MRVCTAGVIIVMVLFVLTGSSEASAHPHGRTGPCEATGAVDWVCPLLGNVFKNGSPLPRHRPSKLRGATTLLAAPGGEASVGFKQQALCQLGPSGGPTEIVTRSPEEADLFRQIKGRTQCRIAHSDAEVGFLCDVTGHCPAVLTANGEFIANNIALEGATASVEGEVERARIIICAGFARVRVENENSSAEVSGGATGNNEFIVFIERGPTGIVLNGESVSRPFGPCRGAPHGSLIHAL